MFAQKQSLLTAAVLAALSLSACGKKQDIYTPPPAETAKTEEKATSKKKDSNKTPSTPTKPRSSQQKDLPEPELGGGIEEGEVGQLPGSDEPAKGTNKNPYGTPPGRVGNDPRPTPRPRPNQPAPRPSEPGPFEPSPSQGSANGNFTGGVAQDGLSYTSSSTDSLIDFLRERNNRVSEDLRRGNLDLAASVVSANLSKQSGDAIVTLKLVEDGSTKTYVLVGSMGAGPASKLRLQQGGETTGSKEADGTLKCVDADGGCENVFARVRVGTPGSASILNVVFRNSGADLFFQLPGANSGSHEYTTLRSFMRNTVSRQGSRITSSSLSTWEVVNGRAGLNVTMKGNNGQTLSYSGPLVASRDNSAELNVSLDSRARSEYASWITGARLVKNDTKGKLQVRFGVTSGERFVIKFDRQIKPIVGLSDDNLK